MNRKMIVISAFLMLAVLTLGAVSASENIDVSDNVTSVQDEDIISDDDDEFMEYDDGEGVLKPDIEVYWPDEIKAWDDVSISYKIPEDMDSYVALFVNNQRVDDGQYADNDDTYNVILEEFGTYKLKLKFFGDDIYAPTTREKTYKVTDYMFNVELNEENITYGDEAYVSVDLPLDASGHVMIDGVKYLLDEDTSFTVPLKNLQIGSNEIEVKYSGDSVYKSKSAKVILNVMAEILYQRVVTFDNATFSLRLPDNAAGSLEVTVDGTTKTSKLTKGFAEIRFDDLALGGHDFSARYTGRDYAIAGTGLVHFEVIPNIKVNSFKSTEDENTVEITLPKGESGKLQVTLSKSGFGEIEKEAVNVTGSAKISFSTLYTGHYTYEIEYLSNSGYLYTTDDEGDVREEFWMDVTYPDMVLCDDDSIAIAFTYLDVETGSIALYVDGELYDELACEELPEEFIIDDYLDVGIHTFTVEYSGNEKYLPFKESFTVESTYLFFNIPDEIILGICDEISIDTVENATGSLAVYVGNALFERKAIKNGFASIDLSSLAFSTYSIRVVYENGNYPALSKTESLTVSYNFTMADDTAAYAGDGLYTIDVPEGISTDKLVVKVDNVEYPVVVTGNKVGVNMSGLDIGSHVVSVEHPGDANFYPLSVEKTVDVAGVISTPVDVKYGQDKSISLVLPENPKGKLVLYEYDENYRYYAPVSSFSFVSQDGNSIAEIPISYFDIGDHKIKLSYSGDDYNVSDIVKELSVDLDLKYNKYVQYGQKSTVTINLPGAQGSVEIDVDGEYYGDAKFTNGVAKIVFKDLEVGQHYFEMSYDGDNSFTFDEGLFVVYPVINVPKTIIDGSPTISVNSGDDPVGSLIVYADGKKVKEVDLDGGKQSISLSSLDVGKHAISIVYDAWDEMTYAQNYTVNIKKASIIAKDMKMDYLSGSKFKVQIKDYKGKAVKKGQKVTFYVDGKKFSTVSTDSKGYASVVLTHPPKEHTVKVVYKATSVTKKVTVKKILTLKKVTVKRSAKQLVLTATLKKVKGLKLKDQQITFKFGKNKYVVKTNSKGVATAKVLGNVLKALKVGKTVTYQATYAKETEKLTAKIAK